MVKKYYLTFLILFLLHSNLFSGKHHMSKEKERIANFVLNETCKEISCKYGMKCIGSGGAMMYEIENLSLMFWLNKSIGKNEARRIIVESAEIFLHKINSNKYLARYLIKCPFDLNHITISVLIHNSDGTQTCHPQLAAVSIVKGDVGYKTNDRENGWVYKEITEESFEEAKQIIEGQK